MHERRFNVALAGRLEDPARLLWLPPSEVIGALAIQSGDSIADIGAGTGYFSVPLAQAAGPSGKVYAVDAQPEMLELLRQKLRERALSNVEVVQAEADSTWLSQDSCRLVFLANVWHEFSDRAAVLRESKRILKVGGRIAILDWRPDVEADFGPPLHHRLCASELAEAMQMDGFMKVEQSNIGRYSWLVQATTQGG